VVMKLYQEIFCAVYYVVKHNFCSRYQPFGRWVS